MLLKDRMDTNPVTDILFLLADFFTNGSYSLIVFNRFIISGKLKPGALLIAKHKGLHGRRRLKKSLLADR
jgi:hypothetical protein